MQNYAVSYSILMPPRHGTSQWEGTFSYSTDADDRQDAARKCREYAEGKHPGASVLIEEIECVS